MPGDQQRPLRKDASRNRQALIAAGREVFQERGLAVTLDDVAHRAGVGVGTAYRHFSSKYELASAILETSFAEMLAAAEDAALDPDGFRGLTRFFEAVLEPQATKRALGDVLRTTVPTASLDEVRTRIERCIDQLLATAHGQASIRRELTSTDIGVLMSTLGHIVEHYGTLDPQLWRRYLVIVLDGIRAETPTRLPGQALPLDRFLERLRSP
jgi:AcrR family transcriptional regulator